MNLYDSKLWIEDIDEILELLPELKQLEGKSVLITGVGGLICSSVADILIRYNEVHDNSVTIYAAARSREKLKKRFGEYFNKPYFVYIEYNASSLELSFSMDVDYIIHGASNASPNNIVREPVETMVGNFTGLLGLFNYARNKKASRVLYISSSEVYGKKAGVQPYHEDEYGYIDLLNPRNSYSVGKRAAETLCASYAHEYGVESVIVRPGHIYGPTALKSDNRVSSAWPYIVTRGDDIIMKSDGSQKRSYCYCLDCASAILKVLLKGRNAHAYNISNPDSVVSIKEMAEFLAEAAGVRLIQLEPDEQEKKAFNPMSNSSLDSERLQKLGWRGIYDAKRGFGHTVKILKEIIVDGI